MLMPMAQLHLALAYYHNPLQKRRQQQQHTGAVGASLRGLGFPNNQAKLVGWAVS